jgi:hypothetical protein
MSREFNYESLNPGDAILFEDMRELPKFEDGLAQTIRPQHDWNVWQSRHALSNLITPPNFACSEITNLTLRVMEEPYERIHDARDRGFTFNNVGGKPPRRLDEEIAKLLIPKYVGFEVTAEVKSAGRSVGELKTEAYYFPRLANLLGAKVVSRIVPKPKALKSTLPRSTASMGADYLAVHKRNGTRLMR